MEGIGYVVSSDLYSISARIKEIDSGYFIFYNYKNKRYEVHNAYQRGSTLSLVLPYSTLDERTLKLVLRSKSERAKEYLQEMEKENETKLKQTTYRMVKEKEKQFEDEIIRLEKEGK